MIDTYDVPKLFSVVTSTLTINFKLTFFCEFNAIINEISALTKQKFQFKKCSVYLDFTILIAQ